jgi:hypothetical protein
VDKLLSLSLMLDEVRSQMQRRLALFSELKQ